jgi:hypothetical protein
LLEKGIKETQLYCLSFSQILFGLFPEEFNNNSQYKKEVDNLVKILQNEEKEYLKFNYFIYYFKNKFL